MSTRCLILLFLLVFLPSSAFASEWDLTQQLSGYRQYNSQCSGLGTSANTYGGGPYYISYWSTGDSYFCEIYIWYPNDEPVPAGEMPSSSIFNLVYTDDQCAAQYGGSYQMPGTSASSGPVDLGSCSIEMTGVSVCTSEGCFSDWKATSTGQANNISETIPEGNPDIPDYLTATDDPASCGGSSVAYGGQSYCVDQAAIDAGTVSIIGIDDTGGTDDGTGVTDDGSTGGTDGGTGGDDGTGGTDGGGTDDGTSGGTGGGGTGTDDGSGDGGGGEGVSPWGGSGDLRSFDAGGEGDALIAAARSRLDTAIADIQADMAGMYFDVGVTGSCPGRELSFHGTTVNLDICSKVDQWGGVVRTAVLLLGALLAFGIILRAND